MNVIIKESVKMTTKERFARMIEYFEKSDTVFETELKYHDPYELIVAVILSAQCTDKRVNIITPRFFNYFPDIEALAKARVEEIFQMIKSCSYPNSKAKNLSGMAKMLVGTFHSQIPTDTELLQQLPGVGRKSAHVIASVLFNKPVMAVDTHVFRVSARLGLTKNAKNPLQCEKQLIKYLSPSQIPVAHHWLILHGRYICIARKPKCLECGLTEICIFYKKNNTKNDY